MAWDLFGMKTQKHIKYMNDIPGDLRKNTKTHKTHWASALTWSRPLYLYIKKSQKHVKHRGCDLNSVWKKNTKTRETHGLWSKIFWGKTQKHIKYKGSILPCSWKPLLNNSKLKKHTKIRKTHELWPVIYLQEKTQKHTKHIGCLPWLEVELRYLLITKNTQNTSVVT